MRQKGEGEVLKDNFETVFSSSRRAMSISISSGGRLSVSDMLLESLSSRKVRLLISCDRKTIIIDEKGEPTFVLPKNGSLKNLELTRKISSAGIALPARYTVEWSGEHSVWVAKYSPKLKLPEVSMLAQKYSAKQMKRSLSKLEI